MAWWSLPGLLGLKGGACWAHWPCPPAQDPAGHSWQPWDAESTSLEAQPQTGPRKQGLPTPTRLQGQGWGGGAPLWG